MILKILVSIAHPKNVSYLGKNSSLVSLEGAVNISQAALAASLRRSPKLLTSLTTLFHSFTTPSQSFSTSFWALHQSGMIYN